MVLTLSYINFHSCSRICLFPQPPRHALIIQHLNQPSTCFVLLCQWKLFSINYKTQSLLRFSWLFFFISGWKCGFAVFWFCLQKYPVCHPCCRTRSAWGCPRRYVWARGLICQLGNACAYMCVCRKDMETVSELEMFLRLYFYSSAFSHFPNLKICIPALQMISGYKVKSWQQLLMRSELCLCDSAPTRL